jgi:hypothetical protein
VRQPQKFSCQNRPGRQANAVLYSATSLAQARSASGLL